MLQLTVAGSWLGLFFAAFIAATLLPAQSEALLAALLFQQPHFIWILLAIATAGNVLGSIVNWCLGKGMEHFRRKRWFPISEPMLDRAARWYGRYGRWSLLLSWMPVIGDPLTVIAGFLREPLWSFVLIVTIAKAARYAAVAAAASRFI